MTDIAIRVENLSKLYRIGARQEAYTTLRDTLAGAVSAPLRRIGQTFKRANVQTAERADDFWALKDVSFEVKRGEVVGIIGRNGAGKSTLLKILSRITEPTSGYADIYGRVGSLLEVGTGFHPELTGRENIFLNGAILGMKRAEIARQFDAIVEFAEVERFVDTAVKHYSSGMYLRLAFAVAAHLEPEILLVDEVLAVGDAQFQKKCLGKMSDVAKEGRTVLFVSHNMNQMRRLCEKGMLIRQGESVQYGAMDDMVTLYQLNLTNGSRGNTISDANLDLKSGFLGWSLLDSDTKYIANSSKKLRIEIDLHLSRSISNGHHGLVLQSPDGANICGWGINDLRLNPGRYTISYQIPYLPLKSGYYSWYASLWDGADRIDVTNLLPDLLITTQSSSILTEEWSGILNLPCEMILQDFSGNIVHSTAAISDS